MYPKRLRVSISLSLQHKGGSQNSASVFFNRAFCALWCVFLWELPQMRFTEKQLNKRLASHELTSVARECSAGQTSVQLLLCPTSCGCSQKKTSHRVQYGILQSTICNSLAHIHAHANPDFVPCTLADGAPCS